MKDLGTLNDFLGMEVQGVKKVFSLLKRKYTLDLLTETGNIGCRLASTPLEQNWKSRSTEA